MSLPKPTTVSGGPWTGVRNTSDPQDDEPNFLVSLVNGYIPDPTTGSSAYARPGATRLTTIPTSTGQTQGGKGFIADDGMLYNFMFVNGKVFRQSTDLSSAPTDVTPTNIWIATGSSSSPTTVSSGRFIFTEWLNNSMIVNDGVNKPWIGTNLGSTPITATTIDFRTASVSLSRGTVADTKIKNASFTYAVFANGTAAPATPVAPTTPAADGTVH